MDKTVAMEEILSPSEEKRQIQEKVSKPLLYLAMGSMVMIFASLTSAYVVRMGKGDWLRFELPQMFYISTAVIIISSVTMNWALSSAKKNDYLNMKRATLITLILGLTFVVFQFKAWGVLVDQKVFFAGKYSNASGSFLYALTGLHLAHLVFGIVALIVVWVKTIMKKYNSENLLGIKLCAIFWHFLDALWIYLFLFLLFVR
ncbi:MAG: cytochrome c oxidase subunit 3 [Bacteroidetes bacterium]|nr:cytochrome c oxidase subunit 3 [Bacteroidota bacterium]